jgi:hypothetical protein
MDSTALQPSCFPTLLSVFRISVCLSHLQPLSKLMNWLVVISVLFSTIAYWLSNFQPTAKAFFTWIMWLFLDLVAAESLVVLVSSVSKFRHLTFLQIYSKTSTLLIARDADLSRLRRQPCYNSIREWVVDVCRWIYGNSQDPQCLLEICVPLHRLPGRVIFSNCLISRNINGDNRPTFSKE